MTVVNSVSLPNDGFNEFVTHLIDKSRIQVNTDIFGLNRSIEPSLSEVIRV